MPDANDHIDLKELVYALRRGIADEFGRDVEIDGIWPTTARGVEMWVRRSTGCAYHIHVDQIAGNGD